MHNTIAQHLSKKSPVPEQHLSLWPTPLSFEVFSHDGIWYEITLWLVWVNCSGSTLSQLLMPLRHSVEVQYGKLKNCN